MQPDSVTLPHTGLTVAHTGYTVTSYREFTTHDGVAFAATLRRDKKIIGTVENTGHGGPDIFYPATDAHQNRADLEAFAAHCTDQQGNTPDLETVLGDLVTEYQTSRDITRAAKRGHTVLRMVEDWEGSDGQPMNMPSASLFTEDRRTVLDDLPSLRQQILADPQLRPHDLAYWQIWDHNANRWADVTERPAHLRKVDA